MKTAIIEEKWFLVTPSGEVEFDEREKAVMALLEEFRWFDAQYKNNGKYVFLNEEEINQEIELWEGELATAAEVAGYASEEECEQFARNIALLKSVTAPCMVSYEDNAELISIDLDQSEPSFSYDGKRYAVDARLVEGDEEVEEIFEVGTSYPSLASDLNGNNRCFEYVDGEDLHYYYDEKGRRVAMDCEYFCEFSDLDKMYQEEILANAYDCDIEEIKAGKVYYFYGNDTKTIAVLYGNPDEE